MEDIDTMTEERRPLHNPIFDPPEPEPTAIEPEPVTDEGTVIRHPGEPWTHDHFRALLEILETKPDRNRVAPRFGLVGRGPVGSAALRARAALTLADAYQDDTPPPAADGSNEAKQARIRIATALAAQGCSSRQIETHLGITHERCRRLITDAGIVVSADKIVGKSTKHDSNRLLVETATGLDGHVTTLSLVDKTALDPDTLPATVASIRKSITAINQKLKEITT